MDWERFKAALIRGVWTLALTGIARPMTVPEVDGTPQPGTHTVKAGDTLWALARRYGIDVPTIKALNPGVAATDLRVGSTLVVAR